MNTEKKAYNAPELMEHGKLIALTQGGNECTTSDGLLGNQGYWDEFTSTCRAV